MLQKRLLIFKDTYLQLNDIVSGICVNYYERGDRGQYR